MPVHIFREIFKPEEFQFVNNAGEVISVFTKFISTKDQQAFLKFSNEYTEKIKRGESVDPYQLIFRSMILRFGKDEEFWKQFSIELLGSVREYFEEKDNKEIEGKKKPEMMPET